jgi:YD repeat-containing protein
VAEYNGTVNLPTELDIPTPSGVTLKYLFAYEPTPQNSGYFTGRLQKVTLPTGGTYEYDYGATNDGINCADGTTLNMTRKVTDGTTTGIWQYTRNTSNLTTTITDAASNDSVYTFTSFGQETKRQLYSGTGGSRTIQRTINTTWATNGTPATQVTILEDNTTQSETYTTYDSNGLLDSMTEYDWGPAPHGSTLRTTTLSYLNTSNYTQRNIINRVTSTIVKDGSGTIKYRQDIAYDGVAITNHPTGVPQHDDANYPYTMIYRGNPTSITVYKDPVTPAQGMVTGLTYDVFGNFLQSSLNSAQQQQFNFSSTTQYAYPDSIVAGPSSGPQLTTIFTYYADTGQVHTAKDPNNQQTTYAYDFLRRPTSVMLPDNSQIASTYNDSAFTANVTTPIDGTRSVQRITAFDALGLPYTTTIEDSSNNIYSIVQTNYDAMGRAYRTSTPYTGTPQYWTTLSFDALSRVSSVTDPGNGTTNGTVTYTYTKNDVKQTLGPAPTKSKQLEYDALGNLTSVCEMTTTLPGNGSCGQNSPQTGYWTKYAYDANRNLTSVTQSAQPNGSPQTRSYSYDALSRMTSETNPESGTTTYQYDTSSICWGGSSGDLTVRTDNAGNVTCFNYDKLHRLTDVSGWQNNTWYSGNGPCRRFRYDATSNGAVSPPTGSNL